MLKQDFKTYQYQYCTARNFRPAFILKTEYISDFKTYAGENKGDNSYKHNRGENVYIGKQGKCNTNR